MQCNRERLQSATPCTTLKKDFSVSPRPLWVLGLDNILKTFCIKNKKYDINKHSVDTWYCQSQAPLSNKSSDLFSSVIFIESQRKLKFLVFIFGNFCMTLCLQTFSVFTYIYIYLIKRDIIEIKLMFLVFTWTENPSSQNSVSNI